MKSLLSKIEFHYTFILVALGFVLTGHFANLLIFSSIIVIHEMGHLLVACIFNYDIDKVIIYPYGGITKLNVLINTNINRDIILSLGGVILQTIYFYFITYLYNMGYIRVYIYDLFVMYHYNILIFNLLPIIPLDGSKIVNLLLSKFMCFNLANKLSVFVSFITIIIVLIYRVFEYNYCFVIILFLLLKNIYIFYRDIDFIYNKFIIERYLYKIKYPSIKIIDSKKKMYKNKTHYFKINSYLIKEDEYLDKELQNHLTNR